MSNGALYIITKDPRYVDMLLTSAASLKKVMPELPITVFSEFPVQSPFIDKVVQVKSTEDGFYDKTKLIRESPYERTLFMDADTYVVEPIPELFSLLDRFDCAATHEEYCSTDWFNRYTRNDIPSSFPEFNTGILMIKRSARMERMLQDWEDLNKIYLQEKPGLELNDQPFFRVAIYQNDVRMATLTREYNCKFRGQGYLNGPVKVLHGHVNFQLTLRHIQKPIRALNASKKPRVYIAGKVYEQAIVGKLEGRRKGRKVGSFPEPPDSIVLLRAKRLRKIVKERGVGYVLAKIFAIK